MQSIHNICKQITDQTIYQHMQKGLRHIEALAALLLCSDSQDWFIVLLSTSR